MLAPVGKDKENSKILIEFLKTLYIFVNISQCLLKFNLNINSKENKYINNLRNCFL